MRMQALYPIATVCVLVLSQTPAGVQPQSPMPVGKGQRLEALAWPEAEQVLTPETVVVLPVGAASKEHGPHLKLRNDLALADCLTGRVLDSFVGDRRTDAHVPLLPGVPGMELETRFTITDRAARSGDPHPSRAGSAHNTPTA